jgi:heat shock protein HslJ
MLAALPLLAALAACSTEMPAPTGPAPADLTGTRWELTRWEEAGGALRPIPHADTGDPITLQFGQASGKPALAGFSGCNQYNGPYTLNGNRLTIGSLVSTKRACVTPQRNQLETDYLAVLDDGVTVSRSETRDGGELRLKPEKGPTLVFQQR